MLDRTDLEGRGYEGFVSFEQLLEGGLAQVPQSPGTYVVLWAPPTSPVFLEESCGGHFKSRNPTVEVRVLQAKWVQGAPVIYVGKAEQLQRRLREYSRFGEGKPVGHWGGRYIWQIEGCQQLVVAWKALAPGSDARAEEIELLRQFENAYGTRPFANLTG